MTKKEINAERRLEKLAGRALAFAGENPIVFLDTGAVIDFEREIQRWKLRDKSITAEKFYQLLKKNLEAPIYITEHIWEEVLDHYEHYRLNGLLEICDDTFGIMLDMHRKYCDFLRGVVHNRLDSEKSRYDAYWASKLAFPDGHKKKEIDPASRTDKEFIASVLWARYVTVPIGRNATAEEEMEEIPISSSIIISPDEHMNGLVNFLKEQCAYNGLEVVSSR